jgi:predicted metal-dependent phosphoesterase TrpH
MKAVDLHTHTNASDGYLTPLELLEQAHLAGIELLSITDHDTTAAYRHLDWANLVHLQLIAGVEFSTQWRSTGIHVLGLTVGLDSGVLQFATTFQSDARALRATRIAEKLEKIGVPDPMAGALRFAGDAAIGRPHFARHMVECGFVKDLSAAFKKHLGAGKIGDIKQHWASMQQIIDWIRDSGGIAVLAHPGKYGLTRTKRLALIDEFQLLGGRGLEVISGAQDPELTATLAATASAKGLLASCGSDFHEPKRPWASLGMKLDLPPQCRPIWDAW